MRYFFYSFVAVFFICTQAAAAPMTDEAERLYQSYGDAVYQVQVIDLTSGKKTSIGSGFQFTEDGLIATNYHVVADVIQKPENNRIEFLHDKKSTGQLKVLIADVVHDLAIVRMDKPGKSFFKIGRSKLPKGTRLFSLGNPHDIGFTIIEGTYNGLLKESFIDRIHFSGSLNPGMSGGPAISHDGNVIGVNVATSGNQISFLVPVEPLQRLLEEYRRQGPGYNFIAQADKHIQDQLLAYQNIKIKNLLEKKWENVPFGPLKVPGRLSDALKCWGGINHKDKDPYQYYFSTCANQDRIFLANNFNTGVILYRYDYMTGKDELNLARFYNFYDQQYSYPTGEWQNGQEGDVTNFKCNSSFIDIAAARWKSSFCVRQYKKYPKLFDMHFHMAMVGAGKKGFTATWTSEGISKENALALARKFTDEIREGSNESHP